MSFAECEMRIRLKNPLLLEFEFFFEKTPEKYRSRIRYTRRFRTGRHLLVVFSSGAF